MFAIQITTSQAIYDEWSELPVKFRLELATKIDRIADLVEAKVRENLSGGILDIKSGQLIGSIRKEIDIAAIGAVEHGGAFIAFVGPIPATPKAWALEYGGKGSYVIPVGKRGVLANRETGFFSKRDVVHPPAKEYAYLRSVPPEIAPIAKEMLLEAFINAKPH